MKRIIVFFFSSLILLTLFMFVKAPAANACNCSSTFPCGTNSCGNPVTCGVCTTECSGVSCYSCVCTCSNPGGCGFTPYCPGSCDTGNPPNSTCAAGGAGTSDCSTSPILAIRDCCEGNTNPDGSSKCIYDGGPQSWASPGTTCHWDYSAGGCRGSYCSGQAPEGKNSCGYLNGEQSGLCQATGCRFTPNFNNCASNSPCVGNTCNDPCGNTTACGTSSNYIAISPAGTINTLTPTVLWSNPPGVTETYSNLWVFAGSNCVYPGSTVVGYANPGASDTSRAWSGLSGTPLSPSSNYSWYIWGTPVGALSNCQNFTTPVGYTCTVSLSTSSPTISVGGIAPITANVSITGGATVGSIAWTSSSPSVGTIPSPTAAGITSNNVTGVGAGNTNITATVNLSPSGSCSTAAPLTITVYPQSWWQVSAGDVYGANIVSNIPATCVKNCYIDLSTFLETVGEGQVPM